MAAQQSTQTTPERWLPVPGYEGYYEVSDQGRVRSLYREVYSSRHGGMKRVFPRFLKLTDKGDGYRHVTFYANGKRSLKNVHRLVAEVFLGPCPDEMEVCHNNGDPSDNRVANLRWGTHRENILDKEVHGTVYQRNKTHCKRGHILSGNNLAAYEKKRGRRRCLSCAFAMNKAKRNPDLKSCIQDIADEKYRSLGIRYWP